MDAHPPDDDLVDATPRPEVARHLESCPRCRVHRRLLGPASDAGAAPPPEPAGPPPAREVFSHTEEAPTSVRLGAARWDLQEERLVVDVAVVPGDHPRLVHLARTLESLSHPHIAAIRAVRRERVLLDAVPGSTLADHDLARDRRAIAWLAQAASAVATLHQHGIVHGALCAELLRITPEGRLLVLAAGIRAGAEASEAADWQELARAFLSLQGPLGELLDEIATGRTDGPALLAHLLARRDPGASGGPRYTPISLLGIGGMGEVRAVHDPVLDRTVAQKLLSRAFLSEAAPVARFLEEARITAQLQHPGIVPVHDLEHLPDGTVAFTMKPIEGHTLAERVRAVHGASGRSWGTTDDGWSLRRLVDALRRVCEAVAFAHDRRVLHLDLKPGNVMLGDYGEVLVVDWGLARRLEEDGTVRVQRAAGTAGYMPPEQVEGGEDPLTPRTDVYALGMCLREILDGEAPMAEARGPWHPRRSDAPRELVSAVHHATRSRPEERTASAEDLARDLTAWLDGRSVPSHDYAWWEQLQRRLRPHQAPLLIGLIAAILISALAMVAWVRLDVATLRAREAQGQALVEKALLAREAGDRVRAEASVGHAIGLSDRPDARGLLAGLLRGWRPALVRGWDESCVDLVVLEDARVICQGSQATHAWSLAGSSAWSRHGTLEGLRRSGPDRWSAFVGRTALDVHADNTEASGSTDAPRSPEHLVRLGDRWVAAVGAELDVSTGSDWSTVSLPGRVVALEACGPRRAVAITEDRHLLLIDLGEHIEVNDLGADRADAPVRCTDDGSALALASGRAIQVWSLDPPVQDHYLVAHSREITTLAWSPDGQRLGSGSTDGTVRIWRSRDGEELGRLPGHAGVRAMAFTADGTGLITATPTRVRHWALPMDVRAPEFNVVVEVDRLHWTTEDQLFVLDRAGRARAFHPDEGSLLTDVPDLRMAALAPDPDGPRLAIVSDTGNIALLDLDQNRFVGVRRRAHAGGGTAIAWRPTGALVASAGEGGDVRAWEPTGDLAAERWSIGVGGPVRALSWTGDGRRLAVRHAEGLRLVDGDDGTTVADFPGACISHAVSRDGGRVALAWSRGGAAVGTETSAWGFEPLDVEGEVVALAFSPDGELVSSLTRDGVIQVFDVATSAQRGRLLAHATGATDLAFSPSGDALASSGSNGSIVMLDTHAFRADAATLEAEVSERYGITGSPRDLEFQ